MNEEQDAQTVQSWNESDISGQADGFNSSKKGEIDLSVRYCLLVLGECTIDTSADFSLPSRELGACNF